MMNRKYITILILVLFVSSASLMGARQKKENTEEVSQGPKTVAVDKEVKTDSKSAQKRDEAIQQLKDLLKDFPDGPRKAEVYRRLAELYWEKARSIKAVVMEDYNKLTDKYYEMNDPNAKMPELDLSPVWVWNKEAINVCDLIIKKYPDFTGIDEVYFFMASNLMEVGQPLRAIRYYTIVTEKYEKSKFAPDAYLQMGEYFFNNNNVFKAKPNYEALVQKYPNNEFYGYALYKHAWVLYNIGEYAESVKEFQQVVLYSAKFEKISLKEDALKDMVNPYAEAGSVDEAESYFKNIVKDKRYYVLVLKKLAGIYFEQDRTDEAIKIYRKLIAEVPTDTDAPVWQKNIVDSYKKKNEKAKVREEILRLVEVYADPESEWVKANVKDEAAMESAKQTAEVALRFLTVEYHNEARKTKAKETWDIVLELYPKYLKYFDKAESAYDMRYNYAECLYDNKRFKEAGDQYQIVADADTKGSHFEDASYGSVDCFSRLIEEDTNKAREKAKQRLNENKNNKDIKEDTVHVAGENNTNVTKIEERFKPMDVPELHQKFIKACDTYIKNIPSSKYLVDIMYKQAITYYAFNHYTEAVPSFELIVQRYPRDELAVYAADLIMDSLVITKDWEAISAKSREFLRNTALISGRNRLKNDLEKFKEMSTFYASEIPASKGNRLESAERYLAFVTEFPKSKFNDVALNNTIYYYTNGGDIYKAIRIQERFLSETDAIYKNSKHRPNIMFGLAKNYQAIAYYDKAAQFYMDFVEKAPTNPSAKDAVYNAAVLLESLGKTEESIDQYKVYIDKFEKDDREKAKIALQFGAIWMRKGPAFYDKAEKGYMSYIDKYTDIEGLKDYYFIDKSGKKVAQDKELKVVVSKGHSNDIFAIYAAIAKMAKEKKDDASYFKSIDKVLQLARAGEFKEKEDLNEFSRDAIAEGMLVELKPEYEEYMAIKFNNIEFKQKMPGYELLQYGFDVEDGKIIHHGGGNPDDLMPNEKTQLKAAAKVKDAFNEVSQNRMKKKIELTVSLQEKYAQIIGATKSPRFTPAVLYYIGKVYKDLTDQMFAAPIAPWLSEAQISAYKNYLDEKAFGAQKNAVAYFENAMKKGYETSVYNEWVAKAKYELRFFQEVTGGKYYDVNDIVPPTDMIETSSALGRIDSKIEFPPMDDATRKALEKKLNTPELPKAVPAAAPVKAQAEETTAAEKESVQETKENK